MKLYLAVSTYYDFDYGEDERVIGIYSTVEGAMKALEEEGTFFNQSERVKPLMWRLHYGQDSYFYEVQEAELDAKRSY